MKAEDVTPEVLTTVAQYIGTCIMRDGLFLYDARTTSFDTWEEFTVDVYEYMMRNFIVEKMTEESFSIGIGWLTKQKWKCK